MKNIRTYSIGIVVWIIINFILFLYLAFNYINFLDIVKYRVDAYTAEKPVSFDLNEVKQAVELFEFLSCIGIICSFHYCFTILDIEIYTPEIMYCK